MKWLIQHPCFGEETDLLIASLDKYNIDYEITKDVPDSIEGIPDIIRGSVEFLESMDRFLFEYEESYYHLANYSCSSYYQYFGPRLLNHDCIFMPWGLLRINKELIFKLFKDVEKLFIRPNSGRKIFTGTTLSKKWWDKELDIIKGLPYTYIKDTDMVVISSAKKILKEYRLLMHKNELISYSIYEGDSHPGDNIIINFFAKTIDYFPDWLYTMDLAWTEDSVKVIELNSFYSSGLYDMDYEKVVNKISELFNKDF
jgi:hypothetical protein